MDITTFAQLAQSVTSIISVVVIGLGYYFMVRTNQRTLQEMKAQRLAGGRPTVIVTDNYDNLPEVDLVIRNMIGGPAKEIYFEFSSPVEDSSGYVISEMPIFKDGLDFLSPNGEISIYWDHLDSLLPYLREKGLKGGFWVRTRYKDLAGYSYQTEWHLDPFIYEHRRYVTHRTLGTSWTWWSVRCRSSAVTTSNRRGPGGRARPQRGTRGQRDPNAPRTESPRIPLLETV